MISEMTSKYMRQDWKCEFLQLNKYKEKMLLNAIIFTAEISPVKKGEIRGRGIAEQNWRTFPKEKSEQN